MNTPIDPTKPSALSEMTTYAKRQGCGMDGLKTYSSLLDGCSRQTDHELAANHVYKPLDVWNKTDPNYVSPQASLAKLLKGGNNIAARLLYGGSASNVGAG